MTAKRKKYKDSTPQADMPMPEFNDVIKRLMRVPPKHRTSKPKAKKGAK